MGRPKKTDIPCESNAKERLLAGAIELFNRKGYAGTTVREIVAAANVTKPVLYYYFANKEGIYLALMQNAFEEFSSVLDVSLKNGRSPRIKITRLLVNVFELFLARIDLARIMYAIYYGPPQGAPFFDFDIYHAKLRETIKNLIAEGIGCGEFSKGKTESMMWAIIGAFTVATELKLSHPEMKFDAEDLVDVLKIIYRGLAPGNRKGEIR